MVAGCARRVAVAWLAAGFAACVHDRAVVPPVDQLEADFVHFVAAPAVH